MRPESAASLLGQNKLGFALSERVHKLFEWR